MNSLNNVNNFPHFVQIALTADSSSEIMSYVPVNGFTERRMGFVSDLTLVGCDETESRTKSYDDLAVEKVLP